LVFTGLIGCAVETARPEPSMLFVADHGADAIVRFDGTTGEFLDVFASGAAQRVDRPSSVRLGPDGQLYAAGFGRGDVVRYDVDSGAMMDVFFWDTRFLEEPVELAFVGDRLIVLGHDTGNAVVLDGGGTMMTSFGFPLMRTASDFVFGPDGMLYVGTDSNAELGGAVQVWDVATGALVRSFATPDVVAHATGVAIDDDGLLYVCDHELDRVTRYDAATGALLDILIDGRSWGGARGRLVYPVSLEIGPDGALYVLDASGIRRFDRTSGEYLSQLVTTETLDRPRSFTFVTARAIEESRAR
jgi:sugar lactone lactonase YvrE